MKNGYEDYFKKANKVASSQARKQEIPIRKADPMADLLRKKMQAKPKKTRKIPWRLAGYSVLGIIMALMGLTYHQEVDSLIKKIEIQMVGYAEAQDVTQSAPPRTATATTSEAPAAAPVENKTWSNDEVDHFAKLNQRMKELDAREEEMNRAEVEIQKQKEELERRLNDLESIRRQISSTLEDKVQADDKKIDTLVQVYSNMKPQQAAKVFETMDDGLAIEILGRMKKKPAAEILNLVKADKAQVLSEKYAGYKRK